MTTTITRLVADRFLPELWLPLVQEARDTNLVAAGRTFDVSGYGEIRRQGDVLHIPRLSLYTAVDKVANADLPLSATTEGGFTLNINRHRGIRIAVEDIVNAQSSYDLMSLYAKQIGAGLARTLDTDILSLFSGLSQTVGALDTQTTLPISDTLIVAALRLLDGANAPLENRSIIVNHFGIEDLRLIDRFTRYDAVGQAGRANPIISGAFGSFYGVPVFVTTNVQTTSVVGGSIANGLVIHREAFAWAAQKSPQIEAWRNGPQLADELIGQTLFGTAAYRADHGVVLRYGNA